ncbi:hypothetical protein BGZ61DRAFT_448266 [Ilyonectria robusta]|uniref:uncharacterized protein n=1 Tax=Ilyonectria robusta TaxID=1079257 RepID=UPI001E8EECE1|nr:uncharacterized protein BGZ61DRAFT_448266 [Ilyonectria robusta]KAH8722237.1 hypothetical protein BGZ61DRAFT_448266 [Ilyonectria robusta]
MAEALAIIPLCWEAIKLGKSLMPKAKAASHYVNEVRDLRTKYGVQAFKLRFECDKVIIKASKEAESADTFSQDFTLSSLSSSDLESRLDAYLGYSRELFIATLEDACQKLKGFEEFFSRFDVTDDHGKEGGSVAHRTQNRIDVATNLKGKEKDLESLKGLVETLRDLRNIADEEQLQRLVPTKSACLPTHYKQTRDASASLYQVLTRKWSCSNPEHFGHTAKLVLPWENRWDQHACLDILVHNEVQNDTGEL